MSLNYLVRHFLSSHKSFAFELHQEYALAYSRLFVCKWYFVSEQLYLQNHLVVAGKQV